MAIELRHWAYAAWLILICAFAVLHTLHLRADFPNNTPWIGDWAKYTDEGYYGSAAVRAHLFGNWYVPGDFNPAPMLPVWPFLEWVLFFFTGVTIQAARGLTVALFFVNLLLSYLLLRLRGPRWMALLAVTLLITSPFLYCFSRLATLEPTLTALTLAALNLAVRLPRFRRPVAISVLIGVLFTLMMLSKPTAIFLLPALGWALVASLWPEKRLALRCTIGALAAFALTFGIWVALVISFGLLRDYRYVFIVNKFVKPTEFYWPLLRLWLSLRGGVWVDRFLFPLAGIVSLGAALAWRSQWSRKLRQDPVFVASLLAVAGCILFMLYQARIKPRYFTVAAFFSSYLVAMGIQALLTAAPVATMKGPNGGQLASVPGGRLDLRPATRRRGAAPLGFVLLGAVIIATCVDAGWTLSFAAHPEYTLVPAAQQLTRYIDHHPGGKRLLLSISGDEISMITGLPTICDYYGTQDLVSKLRAYQPGWFATWNDVDRGTLEDLHNHYSLEQVASFRALDHRDRNVLVLFKLHPLPNGQVRNPEVQNLQVALPGDKIKIPIE